MKYSSLATHLLSLLFILVPLTNAFVSLSSGVCRLSANVLPYRLPHGDGYLRVQNQVRASSLQSSTLSPSSSSRIIDLVPKGSEFVKKKWFTTLKKDSKISSRKYSELQEAKGSMFDAPKTVNMSSSALLRLVDGSLQTMPMGKYFWPTERRLQVYLGLSLVLMYYSKSFNIQIPFILQDTIDSISKVKALGVSAGSGPLFTAAVKAILFYSLLRATSVIFAEVKTCLFSHVWNDLIRNFAKSIFAHFHTLDSTFHMNQPSGILSVAYVRAIRGFQSVVFQTAFSVVPTMLELAMVAIVFFKKFGQIFSSITVMTFLIYSVFTVIVTEWRVSLRKRQVSVDNKRNAFLIDSLLHHETVKLFTSEKTELFKFDSYLSKLQNLSIKSTYAVGLLNVGQALIFCAGLSVMLLTGLQRVKAGTMSIGDLVAVNTMLLQLAIPFNYIGFTYQEIMQSLVDMELIAKYLKHKKPLISENRDIIPIHEIVPQNAGSSISFKNVSFHYVALEDQNREVEEDEGEDRQKTSTASNVPVDTMAMKARSKKRKQKKVREFMLRNISLQVAPGEHVAIVGPSGSGKSTLLKLISRMMTPDSGTIELDSTDVDKVTVESIRQRVAVIPQDTSLFDNTLRYNILFGKTNATEQELKVAIEKSNLQGLLINPVIMK